MMGDDCTELWMSLRDHCTCLFRDYREYDKIHYLYNIFQESLDIILGILYFIELSLSLLAVL